MSKSKKRPYWLDTPCPPWCDSDSMPHRKHDVGSDRRHHSKWSAKVKLSLEDAERTDLGRDYGGVFYSVPAREVYVVQYHREIEPRIVVEGGPPNSGSNFDLTIGEALKMIRVLTTAVDIAEGNANPGRAS